LSLTTVSVVVIAYLGVNSISRAGQSAQQTATATLRTQAEEFLVQLTVGAAKRDDLVLERARQDAKNVASFAAGIFEQPDAFASERYWRAQNHMFVGAEGQYINGENDISTVFVPNSISVDPELIRNLELTAYLDLLFASVYESNPNSVAIYIITKQGVSRLYPNINLGDILPADFMATEDIFYTSGTPESDPERAVIWTSVYNDPAGQGLLVTAVAPIYSSQQEFLGIIGIDVSLSKLSADIEATTPIAGGYAFLINEQGHAIALPAQGYSDILGRARESGELGTDLTGADPAFAPVISEMMAGSTGFQSVQVGNRELFVAYAPLSGANWSLANVVEVEKMLQAVAAMKKEVESSTQELISTRILPAGGIILIIAAVAGLFSTNRLIKPIQSLATAAQQIGSGRWDTPLPPVSDDEIGVLTGTFGTMSAQIRELVTGLEARIAERTADLAAHGEKLESAYRTLEDTVHQSQRRAELLQASVQVSRAVAQIHDLDLLLPKMTQLISQHFGFYHTGIFLIDRPSGYAVLRAANSLGGRRMLARQHKLRVGSEGIVGYVTSTGRPRIALDVGIDAVHFKTPELPETRSEMAVPLRSSDEIIGALDVQSTQEAAFDEEDIAVLTGLADQIAIAIQNAQLFQQTQAALAEAEKAYRRYLRDEWDRFLAGEAQRPSRGSGAFSHVSEIDHN
jgi:putative methionine-R-sulfoxide reductase with GAF domain/HAMP domain-containing protein